MKTLKTLKPEMTVVENAGSISIGCTVKITRKDSGTDTFIGTEASCMLTMPCDDKTKEAVRGKSALFVRESVLKQLDKTVNAVQEIVEGK